jgi:two-component system sensor histidine kinase/response regulator
LYNTHIISRYLFSQQIEVEFRQGKLQRVLADKNMINTVVRNLISNAVKFTPENGKFSIKLSKMDSSVLVTVTDTGIGMPEENVGRLFRVDAHFTREGTAGETGTGLGLILCKEYIDKNNGKIWAESTEGKGSIFYFTVPEVVN